MNTKDTQRRWMLPFEVKGDESPEDLLAKCGEHMTMQGQTIQTALMAIAVRKSGAPFDHLKDLEYIEGILEKAI